MKKIAISAVCLLALPAWGATKYPFEGKWHNQFSDCTSVDTYTHTQWIGAMPDSTDKPICKITKVTPKGKSVFLLATLCNDISGDSPKPWNPSHTKITMTGADTFDQVDATNQGQVIHYTRCP